jgi:hypothetical protein
MDFQASKFSKRAGLSSVRAGGTVTLQVDLRDAFGNQVAMGDPDFLIDATYQPLELVGVDEWKTLYQGSQLNQNITRSMSQPGLILLQVTANTTGVYEVCGGQLRPGLYDGCIAMCCKGWV